MELKKTNLSRITWFGRGLLVGFLLFASLNLVSYHFRCENWENLFEPGKPSSEAIGFPYVIWQEGSAYSGLYIDYANLARNLLVGLGIAMLAGWLVLFQRSKIDGWVREFEAQQAQLEAASLARFSVRGLLLATFLFAALAAVSTTWAGSRELLWFVYLLGPASLIGIAFIPRGIRWQQRVGVLAFASLFVIGIAVWSGLQRGMEFDKVLLGIAVFWTPQTAFAAFGLMIYLYIHLSLRESAGRKSNDGTERDGNGGEEETKDNNPGQSTGISRPKT